MASKKAAEGCVECADGYLQVAAAHGASDHDIALGRQDGQPSGLTRRTLLYGSVGAAVGLLVKLPQSRAEASPVAGLFDDVALWVTAIRGDRPDDRIRLHVLQRDNQFRELPVEFDVTPMVLHGWGGTGRVPVSVAAAGENDRWRGRLTVPDPTLTGHTPFLVADPLPFEAPYGADDAQSVQSADGKTLYVVHSITWLDNARTATKVSYREQIVDPRPVTVGDPRGAVAVDVLDLSARTQIAQALVAEFDTPYLASNSVCDGSTLFIAAAYGQNSVDLFSYSASSGKLAQLMHRRLRQSDEPELTDWIINRRAAFTPGGGVAALHTSAPSLLFLDLKDLQTVRRLPLPSGESRSARPFPDVSRSHGPDALLYNAGPGLVTAVDLNTHSIRTHQLPYDRPGRPGSPFVSSAMCTTQDGRIVIADAGGPASGLWVLDGDTVSVADRWVSTHSFDGVAVVQDTIYAVASGGRHMVVLSSTGSIDGALSLPDSSVSLLV